MSDERVYSEVWELFRKIVTSPNGDGPSYERLLAILPEDAAFNRKGEWLRFWHMSHEMKDCVLAALGYTSLNPKSDVRLVKGPDGHVKLEIRQTFGAEDLNIGNGEEIHSVAGK